jgi:hypothetical protein
MSKRAGGIPAVTLACPRCGRQLSDGLVYPTAGPFGTEYVCAVCAARPSPAADRRAVIVETVDVYGGVAYGVLTLIGASGKETPLATGTADEMADMKAKIEAWAGVALPPAASGPNIDRPDHPRQSGRVP